MLLRDTAPSERRSAQIIYPDAFHQRGVATPATPLDFRQHPRTGQLEVVGFGGGLAYERSPIVARLPQPRRGWLSRLVRGAR